MVLVSVHAQGHNGDSHRCSGTRDAGRVIWSKIDVREYRHVRFPSVVVGMHFLMSKLLLSFILKVCFNGRSADPTDALSNTRMHSATFARAQIPASALCFTLRTLRLHSDVRRCAS